MATLEADGGKIKPEGYRQEFTQEQGLELIRCMNDPVYFIEKYIKVKVPKRGSMPFHLYDFQRRLIRTYQENKNVVAMLSRQCGKTTTAAAYLLWWAIFKDDQYILVASKDQAGADEIMTRLWYAYEELPWFLKPGIKKNDVKTKFFDNGSKIVSMATTDSTGRGLSVSLLYLDEFAFVRPSVANNFWASIKPTLSTGGDCIITSTPNSDEDKFSQIWFAAVPSNHTDKWVDKLAKRYGNEQDELEDYETQFETDEARENFEKDGALHDDVEDEDDAEDGFVSFHAHWTSVPVIPGPEDENTLYRGEKFKRSQLLGGLSDEDWLREFECCFIGGGTTLISGAKLASFRQTVRNPRFIDQWGCRWYEEITPNTAYAAVLDPSGDGVGDDAAIQVWEIPDLRQVCEWNSNESDQDEQARMLQRVLTRINVIQQRDEMHEGRLDIYYSVERNALGIGIIRAIEHMGEERFPGWLVDGTEITMSLRGESARGNTIIPHRGLSTTNGSKRRYAQILKQYIERNLFVVRSKILSTQLKNYVKTGSAWSAKEGTKDDVAMAAILMCHLIDEVRSMEPELDDYVRPELDDYDETDEDHPHNQSLLPML